MTVTDRTHALDERLEARLKRAVRSFATAAPMSEMIERHVTISRRGFHPATRVALAVAQAEGADPEVAIDAAAAIELLNTYITLHDELSAAIERDDPAAFPPDGVAQTINTGDGICSMSFMTLYQNEAALPPDAVLAIARTLYETNLEITAGQGRRLALVREAVVHLDDFVLMLDEKIAAFYAAACRMGALAALASESTANAYAALGRASSISAALAADDPVAARVDAAERAAAIERYRGDAEGIARMHGIDRAATVRALVATHRDIVPAL